MRKQRADLEAELRASVHSDDITNVIVTRETPNKEVRDGDIVSHIFDILRIAKREFHAKLRGRFVLQRRY